MTGYGGETARAKGRSRELDVRDDFIRRGYLAYRIAYGSADVVAFKAGEPPLLIQVKATGGGAYERFLPRDRDRLLADAELAGAQALLAWWPTYGALQLITPDKWPCKRARLEALVA